jgi:hypothetical protein
MKAPRKEKTCVRRVPGRAETGTHQAPPAAQATPQRGISADRSRIGAGNLRITPRPSKRSPRHPHRRLQRQPPEPHPHPHPEPGLHHPPHPKARRPRTYPRTRTSPHRLPPPTNSPRIRTKPHHRQASTRTTPTRPPRPLPRTPDHSHTVRAPRKPDHRLPSPTPAIPLTHRHHQPPRQPPRRPPRRPRCYTTSHSAKPKDPIPNPRATARLTRHQTACRLTTGRAPRPQTSRHLTVGRPKGSAPPYDRPGSKAPDLSLPDGWPAQRLRAASQPAGLQGPRPPATSQLAAPKPRTAPRLARLLSSTPSHDRPSSKLRSSKLRTSRRQTTDPLPGSAPSNAGRPHFRSVRRSRSPPAMGQPHGARRPGKKAADRRQPQAANLY